MSRHRADEYRIVELSFVKDFYRSMACLLQRFQSRAIGDIDAQSKCWSQTEADC
jgi:hypothetical protein